MPSDCLRSHLTRAPEDLQILHGASSTEMNSDTAVHLTISHSGGGVGGGGKNPPDRVGRDPDQESEGEPSGSRNHLRFYEAIDEPLREEDTDSELFLRVTSVLHHGAIPLHRVFHIVSAINYSGTVARCLLSGSITW